MSVLTDNGVGWDAIVARMQRVRRTEAELALELIEQFGLMANALELLASNLGDLPGVVPSGAARSAREYSATASRLARALLDCEVSIRAQLGAGFPAREEAVH